MSTTTKANKLKNRSKKYSNNFFKIQDALGDQQTMDAKEACKLLFELEKPNYDPTVELHIKLAIDPTKSNQIVRSSVVLPHGTGKKVIVAAFVTPEKTKEAKEAGADIVGEDDLIQKIKDTQKIEFDKAIAEPAVMKKLPPIARTLGVAGVMPNPKNNTVGENIAEMIKTIKAGKIDFKNDKAANLHLILGKINKNFTPESVYENFQAALDAVQKAKPEEVKKYILTAHIATTISPSIQVI